VTLAPEIGIDEYFAGNDEAHALFDDVATAIAEIGPSQLRASKSQVAFRRTVAFACVWMPRMYLRRNVVPLVLSVSLPRRDASPRWKEVLEVHPNRFMHHLELTSAEQIDEEVHAWLEEAWRLAE
jgi:hypothetical protein